MGFSEVTCSFLSVSVETHLSHSQVIRADPDSRGAMETCAGIWILLLALHIRGRTHEINTHTHTQTNTLYVISVCVRCSALLQEHARLMHAWAWVVSSVCFCRAGYELKQRSRCFVFNTDLNRAAAEFCLKKKNHECSRAAGRWRYTRAEAASKSPHISLE